MKHIRSKARPPESDPGKYSVPQFPNLSTGDNNDTSLVGIRYESKEGVLNISAWYKVRIQ